MNHHNNSLMRQINGTHNRLEIRKYYLFRTMRKDLLIRVRLPSLERIKNASFLPHYFQNDLRNCSVNEPFFRWKNQGKEKRVF